MLSRIRGFISFAAVVAALVAPAGLSRADYMFTASTVAGTDPNGTTYTLTGGPYNANSILTLTSTGTVNLNTSPNQGPFNTNAAGVLTTTAGPAYGNKAAGTTLINSTNGAAFGAIVVNGGGSSMFQVYPANAANGFGSAAPTTTVTVMTTLGSIFGAGFNYSGLTSLTFRVNDGAGQYGDNAGSFTITGTLTNAVPEPTSLALMGLGGVALVGVRLRRARLRAAA